MTDQDPIADREAKISAAVAALGGIERARAQIDSLRVASVLPKSGTEPPYSVDGGVRALCDLALCALDAPAPDGDAKLLELREWVVKTARVNEESQGYDSGKVSPLGVIRKIDRMLASAAHVADAEVEAPKVHVHKVTQTGEHFCETKCKERDRLRAENERLRSVLAAARDQRDEVLVDLAAARADQAAMARRELEKVHKDGRFTFEMSPGHYRDGIRLDVLLSAIASLPAQQPEPEPDAATAYEGDPKDCAFRGPIWPAWKTVDSAPHHKAVLAAEPGCGMAVAKLWDDGTWRGDMGDHFRPTHWVELPDWPSEFPQSRGEPKPDAAVKPTPMTDEEREAQRQSWAKGELAISAAEKADGRNTVLMKPDAATRDGDEVLLSYVRTHGGLLNPCAFETALLELCRRELARGGK